MDIWYEATLDNVTYNWTGPSETLSLTKHYKEVRFDQGLLRKVRVKINQHEKSRMINHYSILYRVQQVIDPELRERN